MPARKPRKSLFKGRNETRWRGAGIEAAQKREFAVCHGFDPDRRPHSANRAILLRKVSRAPELRLLRRGFGQVSVLSLCKLNLAFGRALKTTNPAALAPFTAGNTGAGLDDAVFIANWLDLRHRVSLTHGWPRRA
ncbi:hypothetical protein [Paraburkholderia dipogonis]|uniref:hypothetical protein n=1 Tax=Paraburkholderia dipogonis TaxID=1211383 RepID=UPI0038B8E948